MTRYRIKNTSEYVWVYEDLANTDKEYVLVTDDVDYASQDHYLKVTDLVPAKIEFTQEF